MAVPLIMQWLIGTWFVVASDAPIWLKGDKTGPTLNYTLVTHKDAHKLLDETKYTKHSKQKTIAGYDHTDPDNPAAFIWRGKGLLFFAKSKWKVSLQDKEGAWAVIYYSKTLFTAEGVDILSRKPTLSAATLDHIHQLMLQDPDLKKHMPKIKSVKQP